MKILVGAVGHESNTFTPLITELADFHPCYGPESLTSPLRGAFAGLVKTLRAAGAKLVPTLAAHAMPGGVVKEEVFQHFLATLRAPAHDVDGVCLFLHGAMRSEQEDYCDTVFVEQLRAQLGPEIPISVALDMHGNITRRLVLAVGALVAYHRAPHTDTYETGVKAAEMLLTMLQTGTRPALGYARIPFLLPGEMAQTARAPMQELMARAEALEERPEIISTTIANSHCWADIPDTGISCVVVADDKAAAQHEAEQLAEEFWARRAEFGVSAEAYPLERAVAEALASPEPTVFLSDSGDNPGAGGTTDVPALLQEMLRQGVTNALFASIWDVKAVGLCQKAGVGQELSLSIGGKLDTAHGAPLRVTGRVKSLSAGSYYRGGIHQPSHRVEQGVMAILTVAGIDVVLTAARASFVEPAQLHALGLEPLSYHVVALKRGYLTAPFERISPRSILAFTPGATNCILTELEYRRVQRPVYPLDDFSVN
ncbi:MAG: M81 family metallopeptidase [Chloroflexota bacterium]|nr:M81 family metallopeptidase [Chloroflexota bacterium]